MKHHFYFSLILLVLSSCKTETPIEDIKIDKKMLLSSLETLASDAYEGRKFGTKGNYKAQLLIADHFEKIGLKPGMDSGYIQKFPYTFSGKRRLRMYPIPDFSKDAETIPDTTVTGGNVIALIPGETEKVIVITAHLDHLGIREDNIYNGADDDASGTAALFAIGDYFKSKPLKHSLVLAAVDAEEIGSLGCQYLVDHFPKDLNNVVLNVNMDMIAHNDSLQLYASGLYHYPQLKEPLDQLKTPIELLYGHDDPNNKTLDDWTFSSDHRIFHKKKIPFIYFGVEDHKDYHKPSDTYENINPDFYLEAVKLIIQAIEGYDSYLAE